MSSFPTTSGSIPSTRVWCARQTGTKTATIITEGTEQTAEEFLQGIADRYAPIKRFASPEEIADFFVFLCSARASYSVGSTYYVDGGWLNVVT